MPSLSLRRLGALRNNWHTRARDTTHRPDFTRSNWPLLRAHSLRYHWLRLTIRLLGQTSHLSTYLVYAARYSRKVTYTCMLHGTDSEVVVCLAYVLAKHYNKSFIQTISWGDLANIKAFSCVCARTHTKTTVQIPLPAPLEPHTQNNAWTDGSNHYQYHTHETRTSFDWESITGLKISHWWFVYSQLRIVHREIRLWQALLSSGTLGYNRSRTGWCSPSWSVFSQNLAPRSICQRALRTGNPQRIQ